MKKLMTILGILILTLVMTSCNSNTPTKVAEKSIACIQKGDYEGYVDLIYQKKEEGKDKKEIEDEKQMLVAMMKDKATKKFEKQDGIKSYEALSEEISEDGKTAIVKMKIVMGDGSETTDDIKLRKDEELAAYIKTLL